MEGPSYQSREGYYRLTILVIVITTNISNSTIIIVVSSCVLLFCLGHHLPLPLGSDVLSCPADPTLLQDDSICDCRPKTKVKLPRAAPPQTHTHTHTQLDDLLSSPDLCFCVLLFSTTQKSLSFFPRLVRRELQQPPAAAVFPMFVYMCNLPPLFQRPSAENFRTEIYDKVSGWASARLSEG